MIHKIKKRLMQPLPGENAHNIMASYKRPPAEYVRKMELPVKQSAVLILIYPGNCGNYHTVLMERPKYKGVHSAQISFPGGKREEQDPSLMHTALRESHEEIGVVPEEVKILGKLSQVYIPPSQHLVTPFVGFTEQQQFIASPKEVAAIISTPLALLLEDDIIKTTEVSIKNDQIKMVVPYFDVLGNVVWGATAMMISELKEVLCDIELV